MPEATIYTNVRSSDSYLAVTHPTVQSLLEETPAKTSCKHGSICGRKLPKLAIAQWLSKVLQQK